MGARALSWGWSDQGVMLTTNPHLGPRLRMSRAIPLLSLCACIAHYGETFIFAVSVELHIRPSQQVSIKTLYWGFLLKFVHTLQHWLKWKNNNGHHSWEPACISGHISNNLHLTLEVFIGAKNTLSKGCTDGRNTHFNTTAVFVWNLAVIKINTRQITHQICVTKHVQSFFYHQAACQKVDCVTAVKVLGLVM